MRHRLSLFINTENLCVLRKYVACLLLSLAALPLAAREFPLCLYGVNDPEDIETVRQAGFDCFQTYTTKPETLEKLAKAAQQNHLKVVFSPAQILGTPYEKKAQTWPILAWYLVDEPDVHRWTREKVQEKYQTTKQAFPNHNATLVIGQGRTATPYYDIPDAMMVDWYPVPHYPLTSFGDQVTYMLEGMQTYGAQGRPAWGVVQAFDWIYCRQFRPDNDRIGRFPTAQEMRFMSYHGILNGATGLFYFIFNHQGKPMPQSAPEYWQRVQEVVQELATLKPVLENGTEVSNPVKVREPLLMKTWQYEGHTYSLLANTTDKPRKVPTALRKGYDSLFGRELAKKIPAYEVWVLKK